MAVGCVVSTGSIMGTFYKRIATNTGPDSSDASSPRAFMCISGPYVALHQKSEFSTRFSAGSNPALKVWLLVSGIFPGILVEPYLLVSWYILNIVFIAERVENASFLCKALICLFRPILYFQMD